MNYLYAIILAAGASYFDLKEDRIPNLLVALGALGGVLRNVYVNGWDGAVSGFISAVIVFAILFPVYLIRGIGAGDVKLFAVMASFFEPYEALGSLIICFGFSAMISFVRMIFTGQLFARLHLIREYVSDCIKAQRVLPYHTLKTLESYIRLAPCMLAGVVVMYMTKVII